MGIGKSIIAVILLSAILYSCGVKQKLAAPKDFDQFHEQFYSDSIFHYRRINFPLEVHEHHGHVKTDPGAEQDTSGEVKQYTAATLPRMLRKIEDYPDHYATKFVKTETGIEEWIYIPNSGYIEKRFFSRMKNRWYLLRVNILDY